MAVALEQRAMADDILIGDTPKAKRRRKRLDKLRAKGRLWKHSTLADIDGVLSASELEPYFIFTLVRNPWDRLVSYYYWIARFSPNRAFCPEKPCQRAGFSERFKSD